jgi:4-aminobutyrate aminotransferase-like enzyme
MVMAKGAANGAPVGITIATPEVGDSLKGSHLSTFGGNPVTAAAILATIDVIEKRKLAQNAERMGIYLRDQFNGLSERYGVIGEVRGMGLMQAMEIVKPNKEPAPDLVAEILEVTKKEGLLVGKAGLYGNVLRVAPPLTVEKGDIDQCVQIMDRAFETIQASHTF